MGLVVSKWKCVNNEKSNVSTLYNDIGNEKLKERIRTCLEWYIEKAAFYKRWFCILSVISIIMPLLITVLNNVCVEIDECLIRNSITICSVIASLSTAFLAFFKFQEKWILYRTTAEEIKKELVLYSANQSDEELKKLVIKIEGCMDKERSEWFLLAKNLDEKRDENLIL